MPVDIQYLKELKELKDAGALDTDEFKAAKAEAIINEREGAATPTKKLAEPIDAGALSLEEAAAKEAKEAEAAAAAEAVKEAEAAEAKAVAEAAKKAKEVEAKAAREAAAAAQAAGEHAAAEAARLAAEAQAARAAVEALEADLKKPLDANEHAVLIKAAITPATSALGEVDEVNKPLVAPVIPSGPLSFVVNKLTPDMSVGVTLVKSTSGLLEVAALKAGSPSATCGLEIGDVIESINGVSVNGATPSQGAELIKGATGAVRFAVASRRFVDKSKSTASAGKGTEEWGGIFNCFDDVGGCIYVSCCLPCATCEMGDMIGPDVMVGQAKEPAPKFTDCCSQFVNCLSYDIDCCGPCIAAFACPDKCWCNYDVNILKAAAVKLDKNAVSPGPCDNACLQVYCCKSCTYCLMYRELKAAQAGAPKANEMTRS